MKLINYYILLCLLIKHNKIYLPNDLIREIFSYVIDDYKVLINKKFIKKKFYLYSLNNYNNLYQNIKIDEYFSFKINELPIKIEIKEFKKIMEEIINEKKIFLTYSHISLNKEIIYYKKRICNIFI